MKIYKRKSKISVVKTLLTLKRIKFFSSKICSDLNKVAPIAKIYLMGRDRGQDRLSSTVYNGLNICLVNRPYIALMKVIWRSDLREGERFFRPAVGRPIIYSLVCRASVDTFSSPSLLSDARDRDFFPLALSSIITRLTTLTRLYSFLYGGQRNSTIVSQLLHLVLIWRESCIFLRFVNLTCSFIYYILIFFLEQSYVYLYIYLS